MSPSVHNSTALAPFQSLQRPHLAQSPTTSGRNPVGPQTAHRDSRPETHRVGRRPALRSLSSGVQSRPPVRPERQPLSRDAILPWDFLETDRQRQRLHREHNRALAVP